MKSFGFHHLGIEAIAYNEQDIAERQKTQRVLELAASRKAIAINPVTVASGKLVAGRDRLAADLLNGARAVWCHVVTECTPADLLRIEVEENVRRRDDTDRSQQLARLSKAIESEIKGKAPANPPAPRKPGRPQTAKGAARAEAAKVAGTTPEAVRRAETRAAAKTEPPKPSAPAPFPIRDFGVTIEHEALLREKVERVGGTLSSAAKALQRAQAAFTEASEQLAQLSPEEVKDRKLPAEMQADAARLREQTHKLADQCRANVPAAICPYCKAGLAVGTPGGVCTFCGSTDYATAHQMASMPIPAELLREGADAMVSNGRGGFAPFKDSRLRGNGAGQAGDKPAHAQVLTSGNAMPGKGEKPGTNKGDPTNGHQRHEAADRRSRSHPPVLRVPAPAGGVAGGGAAVLRAGQDDRGPGGDAAAPQPREDGGAAQAAGGEGRGGPRGARQVAATAGASSKRPRTMLVEVGGRMVDALNPPDDLAYSGDDAPPADLPELVVEPDEAVEYADADGGE